MVLMKRQCATAATEGEPCGVLWVKIGISIHLSPAQMDTAVAKPR